MNNKDLEKLIKESLKDIAIRIYDLNLEDRKSLLDEYKELIINDINIEEILMLPFESYTDNTENNQQDGFDSTNRDY
tara:strand:+ start:220 stop:450 length:231 start_codon:yes stop_codon:yes gene_type:complete